MSPGRDHAHAESLDMYPTCESGLGLGFTLLLVSVRVVVVMMRLGGRGGGEGGDRRPPFQVAVADPPSR